MSDEQHQRPDAEDAPAEEETATGEAATDATGEGVPEESAADEKGAFDLDPALAEAMKDAEASYERRKRGDDEGVEIEIEADDDDGTGASPAIPRGGANEGTIRALAEMRKAMA